MAITWLEDPRAESISVYYEGTSTVQEGMPVCYNYDTTDNWSGWGAATFGATRTEQGTTAEGEQNEGKFIRVEDPATANFQWLAGYVKSGDWVGKAGPTQLDIYVPNGAIIPVRVYKNCSIGDTVGLGNGLLYLAAVTGDGDPLPCAQVMETVDRSSTAGLALCKVFPTGQQIVATGAYIAPVRSSTTQGREYGVRIDGTNFFTGTTAAQSYLLELSGDKESVSTGDAYSALLHISASNYAANDASYTYRGLNCSISNRSGGTLGQMYGGNIAISLKSGSGNITEAFALQIDAQDLTAGTKTNFGGLDVAINREGTAASGDDCGIRIRTRGTINTAINAAIKVAKDATDHGFVNLFSLEADSVDYAALSGDVTFTTSGIKIPIYAGSTTYYLVAQPSI